jgi:hypothetical protein
MAKIYFRGHALRGQNFAMLIVFSKFSAPSPQNFPLVYDSGNSGVSLLTHFVHLTCKNKFRYLYSFEIMIFREISHRDNMTRFSQFHNGFYQI